MALWNRKQAAAAIIDMDSTFEDVAIGELVACYIDGHWFAVTVLRVLWDGWIQVSTGNGTTMSVQPEQIKKLAASFPAA